VLVEGDLNSNEVFGKKKKIHELTFYFMIKISRLALPGNFDLLS